MKMRSLSFCFSIVVACTWGLAARAQQISPTNDVAKFDIDGVRLSMSGPDAIANLKQRFPNTNLGISYTGSAIQFGRKRVLSVRYEGGDYDIDVGFQDALPPTQALEQVDHIEISLSETSAADAAYSKQFWDAILKKYGPPDHPGTEMQDGRTRDHWCSQVVPVAESNVYSYPCSPFSPYMDFFLNKLSITDDDTKNVVSRYVDGHRQNAPPKAVPRF
jgi:hypothetical protein